MKLYIPSDLKISLGPREISWASGNLSCRESLMVYSAKHDVLKYDAL